MDREPEYLQFLGSVGVIGESFRILRFYAKLLGALTLTLILPLCFAILGHNLVFEYLIHKISWDERFYQVEAGTPAGKRIMQELTWERTELLLFLVAYGLFVLAFSLLSTAAAVYTVASIYTGKEVSYKRVMSVVPRVWKRLMVTFLWFFVILFATTAAFILIVFFALLIFALGANKTNLGIFFFCLALITVVFSCIHVYIGMVWHLACVVSILEEKYGLGAMLKSMDLIKGKRITALLLEILYMIDGGIIGWFFRHDVLYGNRHGLRSTARGTSGALLVGLLCFVNLMGLLTQSVFYFVCKSYHHESLDKSSLADHLDIYLGDYVPLKRGREVFGFRLLDCFCGQLVFSAGSFPHLGVCKILRERKRGLWIQAGWLYLWAVGFSAGNVVFYFKATPEAGDYTIYMGLEKFENEELIRYGIPEDIWNMQPENLSSWVSNLENLQLYQRRLSKV